MSSSLNVFARRASRIIAAASVAVLLTASLADARSGGGGSFGSRGSRTTSSVPSTSTAPRAATPLPGAPQAAGGGFSAAPAVAPARSGFGSLLMGGLLGAGLFGLLSGGSLFGGLGGLASMFGLLLQGALLFFVVKLALAYFRGRNQPAMAGAQGFAPGGGPVPMSAPMQSGPAPVRSVPLTISPDDFNIFERRLNDVQGAYSREDVSALAALTTPEIGAHMTQEIADHKAQGRHNQLGQPKLVKGDLAEAWSENGRDYATVAMRYAMTDALVDRTTGRVVSGDLANAQEITEVWTFTRASGDAQGWKLSAIQQA